MIVTALIALFGIALLAAGTPRQAEALFRGRLGRRHRRACRIGGVGILAASLSVIPCGQDGARHLIGWIGVVGIEAPCLALILALRSTAIANMTAK